MPKTDLSPTTDELLLYQSPVAAPRVQARHGYTQPARCMALRHREARPVALWLMMLSQPSLPELVDAGYPLTVVHAFAACHDCIALLNASNVQAFPNTEWKGML